MVEQVEGLFTMKTFSSVPGLDSWSEHPFLPRLMLDSSHEKELVVEESQTTAETKSIMGNSVDFDLQRGNTFADSLMNKRVGNLVEIETALREIFGEQRVAYFTT